MCVGVDKPKCGKKKTIFNSVAIKHDVTVWRSQRANQIQCGDATHENTCKNNANNLSSPSPSKQQNLIFTLVNQLALLVSLLALACCVLSGFEGCMRCKLIFASEQITQHDKQALIQSFGLIRQLPEMAAVVSLNLLTDVTQNNGVCATRQRFTSCAKVN